MTSLKVYGIPLMLALAGSHLASQSPMQQQIERFAREFDGEIGVFAINLATRDEIAVNADARFPTASTIKTAVMLEAYHQAGEGSLSLDAPMALTESDKVGGTGVLYGLTAGTILKVRDLIQLMIVLSDNTATNMLVTRLGTARIDARLTSYGLKETKIFRPTFRDGRPDIFPELEREFGLGMSTPREMARLMTLIAESRAVSAEASAAMLATLRDQQDGLMIPRSLPEGIQVGNKTGIDSEKQPDAKGKRGAIRADAAIVTGKGVNYVIAIFTRRGADTQWGPDNAALLTGARISRAVFDHFAGRSNAAPK
jgi:beta-lactamase class A